MQLSTFSRLHMNSKTTFTDLMVFSVGLHVAMGMSFIDNSAVRYVLPILWMTSLF